VPFLAVAAAELAALARRPAALVGLAACLMLYAGAAVWAVRYFVGHGSVLRPSIASVRDVAAKVDAETAPDERVLSSWPGYLFGTHASAPSDYVNQFAPVAAAKITPASARRLHVASEQELERRIRMREARLVVYRNWVTTRPFARWDQALAAGRYRLVAEVATARIYRR
jgi:hypothetical protein